MPIPSRDITNQPFGALIALRFFDRVGPRCNRHRWLCRCICGVEKPIEKGHLVGGKIKSCGSRGCRQGSRTHGQSHTTEYHLWAALKGQKRGELSPEWQNDFAAFLAQVGPRPDGCVLSRLDDSMPWQPGNVEWTTRSQCCRSAVDARYIDFGGLRKHIAEWEAETGISREVIWHRVHKLGWSAKDALTMPVAKGVWLKKRKSRAKSAKR